MGRSLLRAFWLPLAVLVLWEIAVSAHWLDRLFFPPPSAIASTLIAMARTGELWRHLGATLGRIVVGLTLGAAVGAPSGILMGTVPAVRRSVEPTIAALNSTPKMALFPMLMLFFGLGEAPRLILIAAGCFLTMAIQSADAVASVNRAFADLAVNCGASPAMVWRKVYVPSVTPQMFTGLRLALGRALTIVISTELVGASNGLGGLVWIAWQTFSIDKLYVGVALAAAMGATLHAGIRRLEAHLVPWK